MSASSGQMRDRVRLLVPSTTDDGEGGQSVTWPTNGPEFWAEVLPMTARESEIAGAVQSLATHRVTLHYDARITGICRLQRIAPTGVTLQILGVRDVDGRQRMLDVDCSEVIE
jgi:SPP1 family predicted phage head-tail adaptor